VPATTRRRRSMKKRIKEASLSKERKKKRE
jgi:hypothetical protein